MDSTYERIKESFFDLCLDFFMELRDTHHFRLSADALISFLNICDDIDIADPEAVRANMEMFFCHRQSECDRFQDIFDSFFLRRTETGLPMGQGKKRREGYAGANKNVFIGDMRSTALKDQKVSMSLPNFMAERFFARFEMDEGICDYSPFIHAAFLNLYDDFMSFVGEKDHEEQAKVADAIIGELSRFTSYCRRMMDDPADFCRKALEICGAVKMIVSEFDHTDEASAEGTDFSEEAPTGSDKQDALGHKEADAINTSQDMRTPRPTDLSKKDIRLLTRNDLIQIEKAIRENARKFRARISRSLSRPGHEEFDIKATVRSAFRTAMVPVELCFKKAKPKKVKIVCLLDISPSAMSAATVLINLLRCLSDVFPGGVEMYYFTDHTVKVTSEVRNRTVREAISRMQKDSAGSVSDYSSAFTSFLRDYGADLTRQTIFIILGDFRNNYRIYKKEPLRRIHERVSGSSGRVILLNTEKKNRWYRDDSVLKSAQDAIDEMHEATCAEDIVRFLEEMRV